MQLLDALPEEARLRAGVRGEERHDCGWVSGLSGSEYEKTDLVMVAGWQGRALELESLERLCISSICSHAALATWPPGKIAEGLPCFPRLAASCGCCFGIIMCCSFFPRTLKAWKLLILDVPIQESSSSHKGVLSMEVWGCPEHPLTGWD